MALERVAPERRRQERRARRVIEVHPTAEWLRAVAEEASATPPPHQEQRGRPGSARELANFEANLARVRPPAVPSSVEAQTEKKAGKTDVGQEKNVEKCTGIQVRTGDLSHVERT